MQKPTYKVEAGIVEVKVSQSADFDKDGKPSIEADLTVKLHAYELVTEIAKKDLPMLELVIAQIKAGG